MGPRVVIDVVGGVFVLAIDEGHIRKLKLVAVLETLVYASAGRAALDLLNHGYPIDDARGVGGVFPVDLVNTVPPSWDR